MAPGLKEAFDSLPLGYYGITGDACTLSEDIIIPYTGAGRLDLSQDSSIITSLN